MLITVQHNVFFPLQIQKTVNFNINGLKEKVNPFLFRVLETESRISHMVFYQNTCSTRNYNPNLREKVKLYNTEAREQTILFGIILVIGALKMTF